jgi:hypothetical protein
MADISAFIERIKSNKLAVPALAVGAIAGGYVLFKKGGLSGGDLSASLQTPQAGETGSGNVGDQSPGASADTSGAGELAVQQQTFAASIVDQFNKLAENVAQALGLQQQQTQEAINQLAGQQAQAFDQSRVGFLDNALPDFSSLFQSLAAIPQQSFTPSPGIGLKQTNLVQSFNKVVKPVQQIVKSQPFRLPASITNVNYGLGAKPGGVKFGNFNLAALSGYSSKIVNQTPTTKARVITTPKQVIPATGGVKARVFR